MVSISEAGTVQFPMVRHAAEIGWVPLAPADAQAKRGGEAGLFFRLAPSEMTVPAERLDKEFFTLVAAEASSSKRCSRSMFRGGGATTLPADSV